MLEKKIKRLIAAAALATAVLWSFTGLVVPSTQAANDEQAQAASQQPPNFQAAAGEQKMEEKYKNIQALKGLPASQMRAMMNYISASLGMTCGECHVRTGDQWEFDKDDNPHKKIARNMITMTMGINKASFNGRTQVTCFTCHQGHDHPPSVPPIAAAKAPEAPAAPGTAPKAEEIIAKYVQALGGKEAIEKVKTRVIKGVSVAGNGQSFPLEINYGGTDKYTLSVALPQAATTQKFNGTAGWLKNAREDRAMDSADIARAKSLAWSLEPVQLKEPFPRMGFAGTEKVGDKDCNVLQMRTPEGNRVRFSFDKASGLLLRRVVQTVTAIGIDPEQTDYDDYRDVDGVKVPFTITATYLDRNYNSTRKFTEVKHNAKVDDALFAMPAAKQ
ncbi:MAG: c-type cytochrome [Acidobacteria bacterium]|nr:c-type cytochrome [Acidobacteriota bacterium]